MDQSMYQVSTLQALAMGYTRTVITVGELLKHGDTGLGTFEGVDGEMIVSDGKCYRALEDGTAVEAPDEMGVPFCAVSRLIGSRCFVLENVNDIEELKSILTVRIEEGFGLNSMHIVRIDGIFRRVSARSESGYHTHHVELKDILKDNQKDFFFDDAEGTLVCVYFPDYMDGINAPGWHLHFLSADRTRGGHVFDIDLIRGEVKLDKISRLEIQLPFSPAFDTYSLKEANQDDIKQVEQGK
jgi:acetolactate decarboxylase